MLFGYHFIRTMTGLDANKKWVILDAGKLLNWLLRTTGLAKKAKQAKPAGVQASRAYAPKNS